MIETNIILPTQPRIISEDGERGIYEIEGLYPGYGHTLGNSLRRIILSSLPGAAIVALKIDGVEHEFSTLEGVKEDVIMIILNLKKVRFALVGEEPRRLKLSVKGIKEVKAEDIAVDAQTTIVNPELNLFALTDKNTTVNIELVVEKGMGYVPKERIKEGRPSEIGLIYLDASFTPIRRASYEVENMRVGDRTDFNRLRLHIETDGTVTPRESMEKSIAIMIEQLRAIVGFQTEEAIREIAGTVTAEEASERAEEGKGKAEVVNSGHRDDEALKTRIDDLDLSARVIKALSAEGIRTVGGLARKRREDLLAISGLGEKGIQEIKKSLANFDITLK